MRKIIVVLFALFLACMILGADTSTNISKNMSATKLRLLSVNLDYVEEEAVINGVLLDANGTEIRGVSFTVPADKWNQIPGVVNIGAKALDFLKKKEGL